MQMVVDVGRSWTKIGLFEGDRLVYAGRTTIKEIGHFLKDKKIDKALVSARDPSMGTDMMVLLSSAGYACQLLEVENFSKMSEESPLHPDTIGNIYGALHHYPSNDCIIVDLGTSIRLDCTTKQGHYFGGSLFPGFLEIFNVYEKTEYHLEEAPFIALGKGSLDKVKGGSYFGTLGAIERLLSELRLSFASPGSVLTVATGSCSRLPGIKNDLQDFIDLVDPQLTLIGLNQILKG